MQISSGTLTVLVLVTSLAFYALLRFGELMVVDLNRRGKARVVWLDANGRKPTIEFHEAKNGKLTVGKGESAKTYILEAEAMYPGRYRTWLIDPETGWNYRAPTRAETVDKDKHLAVLSISNPASYHKAIARNEWADVLAANDQEESAWAKNAGIIVLGAVVTVLGLFGVVGFLIFKVSGAAVGGGP